MNWITRNNYTIKRKFNQFNNDNNNNNKSRNDNIKNKGNANLNGKERAQNNNQNQNQINYNINVFNQDNDKNKNLYTNMYYQINGTDNLEQQLKNGENIIQNNLNCRFILSELSEF